MELVELIKLGFHGTALAFSLLSYRLLKKVLDLPASRAAARLDIMARLVKVFMTLSLVMFLAGAGLELWFHKLRVSERPAARRVTIIRTPELFPEDLPPVVLSQAGVQLEFSGKRAQMLVDSDTDLLVDAEQLGLQMLRRLEAARKLQVLAAVGKADLGLQDGSTLERIGLREQELAEASEAELGDFTTRLTTAIDREINPSKRASLTTSLGWVYFTQGDLGKAEQTLRTALDSSPDAATETRARNNLARVLIQRGEFEEPKNILEGFIESSAAREALEIVRQAEARAVAARLEGQRPPA